MLSLEARIYFAIIFRVKKNLQILQEILGNKDPPQPWWLPLSGG
jgi:hypothetical protein